MSNIDETKLNPGEPEIDELTKDRYLGGHEYDGIRELDNKLPRWWVYLFFATIIFAVVYLLGYHVTKWWPLQEAEYANELSVASDLKKANPDPVVDIENMIPLTTAADLEAGHATFKKICSACHGQNGEGNAVGPNFTDQYWIHGDTIAKTVTIKNLYKVVIEGATGTAMVSFKSQLSPIQIQQVLSFILSLQGTNPQNPKAPQGVKYEKIG